MFMRKTNIKAIRTAKNGSEGKTANLVAALLLGAAALLGGCDEANLAAGIGGISEDGWYDAGYWDDGSYSDDYYGGYDAGDAIETYLGNYVVY